MTHSGCVKRFSGVLSGVCAGQQSDSLFVSVSALFVPGWDFIYPEEAEADPTLQKTINLGMRGA